MSGSIFDLLSADNLKRFPWICIIYRIIFLMLIIVKILGVFSMPAKRPHSFLFSIETSC